jgi:hypothetical protein
MKSSKLRQDLIERYMRVNKLLEYAELSGFLLPALVVGYAELLVGSKEYDVIANGLVSSITGISKSSETLQGNEGLRMLSFLNIMVEIDEFFWGEIKELRILMLLNSVLEWPTLTKQHLPENWIILTEFFRLMRSLLPWITALEGRFWGKITMILKSAMKVSCSEIASHS